MQTFIDSYWQNKAEVCKSRTSRISDNYDESCFFPIDVNAMVINTTVKGTLCQIILR